MESKMEEVDRVYIREKDRADYKRLRDAKDSPLYDTDNKNLFILAMSIGFYNQIRIELGEGKFGFVRTEYFKNKEKALIYAVAIFTEGTIEVLKDKKKVYSIAEEYATGGIRLLKENVFESEEFASYFKRLESQLLAEIERLGI